MQSATSRVPGRQKQKRCWNCRNRKIACDRTQPSCQNCRDRKQTCLGYGLKLSWPRDNDSRRFARAAGYYLVPVQAGRLGFINTAVEDIGGSPKLYRCPMPDDILWLSQLPYHTIGTIDPLLTDHGSPHVSRLISSSLDADDLYALLMRLSINDNNLPTLATRHAISALSFQHVDSDKAILHQTYALRALQATIVNFSPSWALKAIAASMLLSLFETSRLDASAMSWTVFFGGAKTIALGVTQPHDTYYGDKALILDWMFYHGVMYRFAIHHWHDKNPDQIKLAAQKGIVSKAVFAPERQIVVPMLGCSLDMMYLICQAVDAVLDRDDPDHHSETHLQTIRSLELRLQRLGQQHSATLDVDPHAMAINTDIAELYRLATLVYLCRVARADPRDSKTVSECLTQAFAILAGMTSCDRPWPFFVLALEASTDEHRKTVLAVLEGSLGKRKQGNMALTGRMIRDAWVQQDLRTTDVDPLELYDHVISRNRVPPAFFT